MHLTIYLQFIIINIQPSCKTSSSSSSAILHCPFSNISSSNMKSHSSTHSSSSSSSSSSWLSFTTGEKRPIHPNYHSSLHSVRKPVAKLTKKPIAPIPPTPPRVYTVQALQFKQVVQMLTAAPEFQSSRLHKLAPSPLALNQSTHVPPPPLQQGADHPLLNMKKSPATGLWNTCSGAADIFEAKNSTSPSGWFALLSPLSSNVWSPFPILSPGTISAFGF